MTYDTKRRLLVGVIATLVGVITLPLIGAAWNSKVSTSDYELHLANERAVAVRDSMWRVEQQNLTLDVLCAVKPMDRRCAR